MKGLQVSCWTEVMDVGWCQGCQEMVGVNEVGVGLTAMKAASSSVSGGE